jgi:hypothetical protein
MRRRPRPLPTQLLVTHTPEAAKRKLLVMRHRPTSPSPSPAAPTSPYPCLSPNVTLADAHDICRQVAHACHTVASQFIQHCQGIVGREAL